MKDFEYLEKIFDFCNKKNLYINIINSSNHISAEIRNCTEYVYTRSISFEELYKELIIDYAEFYEE